MSNISPSQIEATRGAITSSINSVNASIASAKETCQSVRKNVALLKAKDGQVVPGSEEYYSVDVPNSDGTVRSIQHKKYQTYKVTGGDNVAGLCSQLDGEIADIENTISNIQGLKRRLGNTAETVTQYIVDIQDTLSDRKINGFAWETLKNRIAYTAGDVDNGNYLDPKKLIDKYWKDGSLQFRYDEKTGQYIIYQDNVAMGWTNVATVALVLSRMKNGHPNASANPTASSTNNEIKNSKNGHTFRKNEKTGRWTEYDENGKAVERGLSDGEVNDRINGSDKSKHKDNHEILQELDKDNKNNKKRDNHDVYDQIKDAKDLSGLSDAELDKLIKEKYSEEGINYGSNGITYTDPKSGKTIRPPELIELENRINKTIATDKKIKVGLTNINSKFGYNPGTISPVETGTSVATVPPSGGGAVANVASSASAGSTSVANVASSVSAGSASAGASAAASAGASAAGSASAGASAAASTSKVSIESFKAAADKIIKSFESGNMNKSEAINAIKNIQKGGFEITNLEIEKGLKDAITYIKAVAKNMR